MMLKNCLFDLYGTLVDIHTDEESPDVWRGMAEFYNKNNACWRPDELRNAYEKYILIEEQKMQREGSKYGPEIRVDNVFARLFTDKDVLSQPELIDAAGKLFRKLSTEYIRLYDGVPEMLAALREHGIGVWLLSNAQRLFTGPELDALGLTELFDGIYLSSDYGVKKPDPEFFSALLHEQNICTDSACMVGNDGSCDIGGAHMVGLHTVYIHSNISPEEPLPEADHVLTEMNIQKVKEILLSEWE